MAEPSTKSPEVEEVLERVSKKWFGRSRLESIRSNICVMCGSLAEDFRDELSRKEFSISGICQKCQDKIFGKEKGEEG